MSTVKDYQNRIVDMAYFQGVFPSTRVGEQLLAQELVRATDGGSIVAGIQKLVQRVMLVLLTPQGTLLYAPLFGTQFMIQAQQGLWRTVADVQVAFYAARLQVGRQVSNIELDTDPNDERYDTMDLLGVTLTGDKITIRVQITSLAGTSYTFLTPITVPIK